MTPATSTAARVRCGNRLNFCDFGGPTARDRTRWPIRSPFPAVRARLKCDLRHTLLARQMPTLVRSSVQQPLEVHIRPLRICPACL
jgi:hypothetical protein